MTISLPRELVEEAAEWMLNFQRLMSPQNLSDYGLSLHTRDAASIEVKLRAALAAAQPEPERPSREDVYCPIHNEMPGSFGEPDTYAHLHPPTRGCKFCEAEARKGGK